MTAEKQTLYSPGDAVVVNAGVLEPKLHIEIGGWRGRVNNAWEQDEEQWISVEWDQATLQRLEPWMIDRCEKEEVDYRQTTLAAGEVTPAEARKSGDTQYVGDAPAQGPHLSALTHRRVRQLADSNAIFQRGERYLRNGAIKVFTVLNGRIEASVQGSYGNYAVIISEDGNGLHTSCTCPYGGNVCKHQVAVMLRFAEGVKPKNPGAPATASGPIMITPNYTLDEVQKKLAELRARRSLPANKITMPFVNQPAPLVQQSPAMLPDIFRQAHSLSPLFTRAPWGTEQAGIFLFQQGMASVGIVDDEYATVEVRGTDQRNYQVSVSQEGNTLAQVTLLCNCTAGRRNSFACCEHAAAAAYALRQYLIGQMPLMPPENIAGQWESRLTEALSGVKPVNTGKSRSILLFSLQNSYSEWKLKAFLMPISMVDAATLNNREALQRLIMRLKNTYQIREIGYSTQAAANMFYSSQELANMARLLGIFAGYHASNPLAMVLPYMHDALLFLGGREYSGHPFKTPIREVDTAPRPLQLTLEPEESGMRLMPSLPDGDDTLLLTPETTQVVNADPLWVLIGDRLLRVSGNGMLLNGMLTTPEIIIPTEEKKTFLTTYLPKLLEDTEVRGEELQQCETLDVAPVCRLYLSEEEKSIVAELAFAYDSYELPADTSWPTTTLHYDDKKEKLVNISRKGDQEETHWRGMSKFGLKRNGERFVLRQKVTPVDFLLRHVPQLQAAGFEIFGEEALKTARINRNQPKLRLVVSSGIDWFDVLAVVSYGDLEVTLSDIRKAIKQRQGYVKLPDGSLGALPEELLAQYRQIFALGESTEQGVRLSRTQATLLELLLHGTNTEVDAEYTRHVEALHNFQGIETRPLPAGFRGELRPYQLAGYNWLHFLHDYGFGGCLADDMGIGKTVQALVFLQSLYAADHAKKASLIVMPRSLLENWAREAARFTPDLRVLIHADGDRSDDHESFDAYHLVLTTYGVMLRDLEMFNKYRFHYLVLDEAQAIKNPVSQSARAARLLQGEHRLALTGTPVENSTDELWSLFAFLNPGQLGAHETFREQFSIPIQRNQDEAAAGALRALLHPFILRRTKEQVAPELPPRTERLLYCPMTPSQRKLYQQTRDKYRCELLGLIDKGGMQQARFKVLEGLLRLRQLANDPRLVEKSIKTTSSKFEAVLEALEILREEGHKALVFSQFTSMLALLRTALDANHWPYLYLDGKTTNRQELVDRFQTNEAIPFFLISLKAGGLGLNLTAADYVLHIDPWWNPAVERQAAHRTHRIGQVRPVMIYKFIAEETVEEKILLLQEKKRALVEQLISTEGSFMKSLTRDDVAALFG